MERFTISLSDALAADFDQWIASKGYSNRSEAVRDLLRKEIVGEKIRHDEAEYSVANISFIYNHHERCLAERLTSLQHDVHDLVICSSHVHLDHDNCMETLFLKGLTRNIRAFADKLSAESGVRHSVLNLIPVQISEHGHGHHHTHPLN